MKTGKDSGTGQARADIATAIARLQAEYYGQAPTQAKGYISDDVVAVVLEETFTPGERTLIARGELDTIKEIRRRFQHVMADEFKRVVEHATGRTVRAFLSETDIESDISVEFFLLSDQPADTHDAAANSPHDPPG